MGQEKGKHMIHHSEHEEQKKHIQTQNTKKKKKKISMSFDPQKEN